MKEKILEGARQAIKKGFGKYFCMAGLTWENLLAGYEAGNRLIDYQEAEIVAKINLLK